MACGISVPQPGIESQVLAVKASSPNHWTARKLPTLTCYFRKMGYNWIMVCSKCQAREYGHILFY